MARRTPTAYKLYHALWAALDLLLPPVCAGCGAIGSRWCATCVSVIAYLPEPLCQVCGTPIPTHGNDLCTGCARRRPVFKALRSWSAYDGPVRSALLRLKYRRDIGVGEALVPQFAAFMDDLKWPIDVIVPVPLGRRRLSERGYNQVELIAWPLAVALGVQYAPAILHRIRETHSQVGLTRDERHQNVQGAFEAVVNRVDGRRILLVDDVATTGSTLSSCASALYASGARDVFAASVARAYSSHHMVGA